MVDIVSALAVVTVGAVASLVVAGVRGASLRSGTSRSGARRVALVAAGGIGGWLVLLAILSLSGFLADFTSRPPRMMLVLAGSIGLFTGATRTKTFGRLLASAPAHWPIAIQTMRIPIELGLWSLFVAGRMPVHMTFEGRNFDGLVGLTAPFVAVAVARGWLGRRGALAWNVLSLGLLANVVGMALTTMPGPLQLAWPGPTNAVIAQFPFVWLPGFLVPVALFGHVSSLRQLLARGYSVPVAGRAAPPAEGPVAL